MANVRDGVLLLVSVALAAAQPTNEWSSTTSVAECARRGGRCENGQECSTATHLKLGTCGGQNTVCCIPPGDICQQRGGSCNSGSSCSGTDLEVGDCGPGTVCCIAREKLAQKQCELSRGICRNGITCSSSNMTPRGNCGEGTVCCINSAVGQAGHPGKGKDGASRRRVSGPRNEWFSTTDEARCSRRGGSCHEADSCSPEDATLGSCGDNTVCCIPRADICEGRGGSCNSGSSCGSGDQQVGDCGPNTVCCIDPDDLGRRLCSLARGSCTDGSTCRPEQGRPRGSCGQGTVCCVPGRTLPPGVGKGDGPRNEFFKPVDTAGCRRRAGSCEDGDACASNDIQLGTCGEGTVCCISHSAMCEQRGGSCSEENNCAGKRRIGQCGQDKACCIDGADLERRLCHLSRGSCIVGDACPNLTDRQRGRCGAEAVCCVRRKA